MVPVNVFCIPFAGGNKYSYREYEQCAPAHINIIPLEYPGRGSRIREGFIKDMDALVDDIYQQMSKVGFQHNYAIYGHSLGGVVALFLARKILAERQRKPLHLFITGTTGPSSPARQAKKRYLLSKEDFIEELKELDGCPEEILNNPEMLDYFEPILRADFEVSETFNYVPAHPLDLSLTVITGTEEDMETEDIRMWQLETSRLVDFRQMPGKHFFIFNNAAEILNIISEKILLHTKAIFL
ncbi:thioesterase domain-containing protein [Chitinophaga sp.]|uniref:thioesterase II family protein n=1 Tax=Chitinophaga sp. TaxID=1869181 RepID=UPI0025BE0873|nr:thioesterase domain-containing protein [Chitinophaga sp.]